MAKKKSKWTLTQIVFVSAFVIAIAAAGIFLYQYMDLKKDIQTEKESAVKATQEKVRLTSQFDALKSKKDEMEKQLEEVNAKNMVNEVHVERLSKENDELRQILDEYAASMKNMSGDLSTLAKKSQELQARYQQHSKSGGAATAEK